MLGSSRIRRRGFPINANASASLCLIPAEYVRTFLLLASPRPTCWRVLSIYTSGEDTQIPTTAHPWIKRRPLEHDADLPHHFTPCWYGLTKNLGHARGRPDESEDRQQRRCLPRPIGAEETSPARTDMLTSEIAVIDPYVFANASQDSTMGWSSRSARGESVAALRPRPISLLATSYVTDSGRDLERTKCRRWLHSPSGCRDGSLLYPKDSTSGSTRRRS